MFDLVIVGGGIVGATALFLANQARPEWRTLLLERSLIAKGASAYSAGLDFPYGRTPGQKQLSMASERMYTEFKSHIPNLPIRRLPFVGIVNRKNLEQVRDRFSTPTVRVASFAERQALLASLPGFRVTEGQEILLGSCGAIGLVDEIATLLVSKVCHSPGGECWEGVAVVRICSLAQGGHELEVIDGRRISAQRVLIATGPWILGGPGNEIAKKAGVKIKKVAALHVISPPAPDSPILYLFDEDAFLLPAIEHRKWIFSFTSQEWDCAPDPSTLHITSRERNEALAILDRYHPDMVQFCSGGRVFCDAYSRDWAPFVRSDPDVTDLVIAGACSGAGFRLAPAIALHALRLFSGFASSTAA